MKLRRELTGFLDRFLFKVETGGMNKDQFNQFVRDLERLIENYVQKAMIEEKS